MAARPGPPLAWAVFVEALAIDPDTPARVYSVVAGMGAFKSENAGVAWSPTNPANDLVRALAIDSITPGAIYAGVSDGVYWSADGGTTWDFVGLSGHAVSALASYASALYATTQHGTFKSIGGGAWTATERMPSAAVPQTPTTLYTGTASGAFKSVDGGGGWDAVNVGLTDVLQAAGATTVVGPIAVDPTAPHIVFAATELGVFKSGDSAATWQHLAPEDCFNGIDDDGNTLIDGQDPACPLTCLMGEPCPPGYVCNPNGFCEPHCINGYMDGDEGDVDCGGSCSVRCQNGQTCWVGSDCQSGICNDDRMCLATTALYSVRLAPASVPGGSSSVGTVILIAAAPAEGMVVPLSSSNTAVAAVPASVTVPAGATNVGFVVTTNAVTSAMVVTISATGGGATRSAQLTVTPAPSLTLLSLQPTSVTGGSASTGTVTLSATGGAVVTLYSSNTVAATVPASVTLPSTSTTATFPVTTKAVTTSTTVTITATLGGDTRPATLTVNSPPPAVTLSSLALNPTTVKGGYTSTGTVTLSGPAPTDGQSVNLSSSPDNIASVPSSITVPAGATSTTFIVSTSRPASNNTKVTISAKLADVTKTTTLTVRR